MLTLYNEKNYRIGMYHGKLFDGERKLLSEVVYEISVLKKLETNPLINEENRDEVISKISRRIEEILDSYKEVVGNNEITVEDNKNDNGNLFLLMHDDISFLEEDINVDSNNKGISKEFYSDIIDLLKSIQNRNNQKIITATSSFDFKDLKKYNVLFNSNGRVKVFFIPIGLNDAIIIGCELVTHGNDHLRRQDSRVKNYSNQIDKLIELLKDNDKYEELEIISMESIKDILKRLNSKNIENSNLEDMFTEENTENESSNQSSK